MKRPVKTRTGHAPWDRHVPDKSTDVRAPLSCFQNMRRMATIPEPHADVFNKIRLLRRKPFFCTLLVRSRDGYTHVCLFPLLGQYRAREHRAAAADLGRLGGDGDSLAAASGVGSPLDNAAPQPLLCRAIAKALPELITLAKSAS
jgi:hypothetical protein